METLFLIILIIAILLFSFALFIYQSVFGHREEIKPGLKYYTNEELGVNKSPYSFVSSGVNINGFIYEIENNEPKGIIILVHGMGGGHINYMNEICYFAKLGYKVISYDNYGTMLSEGKNLKGFQQTLNDLRACILSVNSNLNFAGLKVILYGHSWGGYAVSAVSNFKDIHVDGIVSLAAFDSPTKILTSMVQQSIGKTMVILYPFFKIIEMAKFGEELNFTSLEGYKKCNCPVLLIHGEKDNLVLISVFRNFREKLKDYDNVEFIELSSKYHRPNISDDGVTYDNWFNSEAAKIIKEKGNIKDFYEQGNYDLLTKFDDRVMDRIKEFILKI